VQLHGVDPLFSVDRIDIDRSEKHGLQSFALCWLFQTEDIAHSAKQHDPSCASYCCTSEEERKRKQIVLFPNPPRQCGMDTDEASEVIAAYHVYKSQQQQ
jgi:hypothetical protein